MITNKEGYKQYNTFDVDPKFEEKTRGLTQEEINKLYEDKDHYGSKNEVFLQSPEKKLYYNEDISDNRDDWLEIVSEKTRTDKELPRPFMSIDQSVNPKKDIDNMNNFLKERKIIDGVVVPEPILNSANLPGVSSSSNTQSRPSLPSDRYIPSHENKDMFLIYNREGNLKYVIRYDNKGYFAVPAPSYKGNLPQGFTKLEHVYQFFEKHKNGDIVDRIR